MGYGCLQRTASSVSDLAFPVGRRLYRREAPHFTVGPICHREDAMESQSRRTFLKFLVPSVIGAAMFLLPVSVGDSQDILSGVLVDALQLALGDALVPMLVILSCASAVLTVWHRVAPISFIAERPALNSILTASPFWTAIRVAGSLVMLAVFFGVGPAILISGDTGGNILFSIIPTCALWYFVGGLFLPYLTDYGLFDLVASCLRPIARPIFRVPGRSMVDCVSSWVGSSVVGVYLTISQYEKGYYTAREAVTLMSGFELLSISFCSMIASMLGLSSIFGIFYGTICIAGLVCAIVLPRLWPICSVPDTYCDDVGQQVDEEAPDQVSNLSWGYQQAMKRAEEAPSMLVSLGSGALSALNLMVSTLPSIMVLGTAALIVALHTSVFDYLGAPLGLYLSLFNVPQAMEVGSTMLVGFADQMVPVILGAEMPSLAVRFLIGAVSILQILYMTDIGTLILTSRVPFSFGKIFLVYLERVLISIPLVIGCGYLFGVF